MVSNYDESIRSYDQEKYVFNDIFPNRQSVSKSTFQKTIHKFDVTRNIKDRRTAFQCYNRY